jgi:hypothetical protein
MIIFTSIQAAQMKYQLILLIIGIKATQKKEIRVPRPSAMQHAANPWHVSHLLGLSRADPLDGSNCLQATSIADLDSRIGSALRTANLHQIHLC